MSDRDEYTDAEWATLAEAPVAVIAAVIGASPSGPIGLGQEIGAAVQSFERAAETRRANPLLAALLVTLKARFERFIGKEPEDAAATWPDIMTMGQHPEAAVAALRAANALLAARAPLALADELRDWLLELGQAVAEAAAEGGFFGLGGEQVSSPERAMLAELAAALGRAPAADAAPPA